MTTSATHRNPDSAYGGRVEFKVLGPLEVFDGDARLELGGPKQRVVLAVLIANAGTQVAVGTLIEATYGEDAPERAHRSIHTFISNLRGVVGELIERRGDGYAFTADRTQFDALRFEDAVLLANDGDDPREASDLLCDALEMWRGHPYAGVEAHTVLEADITRLNELRVSAIEARVEADLDMGRDGELVAELEALTTEHPLNERLRSQQMLALYRAGRQAESLRAYEKTRLELMEMGLDPSAGLRELEQRILNQDSTLTLDERPTIRSASILVADVGDADQVRSLPPDERHRLLSSQAAALDHAVIAQSGRVFSQRGSALYARFDDATDAAFAAAAAQVATGQDASLLRIAIASGDVEESGVDEVSGPPISRAAALVAVAHGGQVLLSSDAHAALTASGSPGVGIRSLGSHSVPGMDLTGGSGEPIYQLEVDGEFGDFPPLRIGEIPPPLPASERGVVGYELREEVGTGPYGAVHRAYQPSIGREVAVKVISPEFANDTAFIRRFEVEAQLLARLEHPNIVSLHDYWRDPDGAFLVMRWLRGGSLAARLVDGPLSVDELDPIVRALSSALEYAHRHGVAHGGLKPSNVLFDDEGNVYLSDFSVGRAIDLGTDSIGRDVRQLARLIDRCAGDKSQIDDLLSQATSGSGYSSAKALAEAWAAAIGRLADDETRFTPARNPYKGLRAFGELDAADFYGRSDETNQLIEAMREKRLIAVVGPSGIGKSSVVRAGLVSAIRAGAIEGSDQWLVTDMMPGRYPYEELASSLLRVASTRSTSLEQELRRDARGLVRVSKRNLPEGSTLLLVVDQFEEIFTLLDDDEERASFLEMLTAAVLDDRCDIRVVLTMRADFFDRPLRFGEFGDLLRDATVPIASPTAESMRVIVEQPALNEGISFEPGLVERILADVGDQPGALPLLEFSLTEIFDQRTANQLSMASYVQTGGVLGALGRRAEFIYETMSEEEKAAARQLFLRLVHVEESGKETRRRARTAELNRLGIDGTVLDTVITAFGDHRLLTFDRDPITRGSTVEVAHEALLSEWDLLSSWINDQREDLLLHRGLSTAFNDWESADRSDSYLLSEGRLAQHLAWTTATDLTLTIAERGYLEVSASFERQASERRLRTRRWVMAGFIVAAAIAFVFAFTSRQNASDAEREAARADANAADARTSASLARARELGASAVNLLDEDPELSILLNLQAIAATPAGEEQPVELIDALWSAVTTDRLEGVFDTGFDDDLFVALSPDEATLFVVVGFPGIGIPENLAVQAYSTTDLERLWEYDGDEVDLEAFQTRIEGEPVPPGDLWFDRIHVSPDGERVALGLTPAGGEERFIVLDADNGTLIRTIESEGCDPDTQQTIPWGWSPDGTTFVVSGNCARDDVASAHWVEILDGVTFAPVALIERTGSDLTWASFDDAGKLYLFADDAGVAIHDASDFSPSVTLDEARGKGDVAPDGSVVVTFDRATARLKSVDTATGAVVDKLTPLAVDPAPHGLAFGFSGADNLFAMPTQGSQTLVWDIGTGGLAFSLPSGIGSNAVATSDGRRLYTAQADGHIKVWDLSPSTAGLIPAGELGPGVVAIPNTITAGETIAAFDTVGTESVIRFFDLDTGELLENSVEGHLAKFILGNNPLSAVDDDRFLITGTGTEELSWFVYDPVTAERVRVGGCELDLGSGLCINGDQPGFIFWVVSDDGTELLKQGDGTLTLVDPGDGSVTGQLDAELWDVEGFEAVVQLNDEVVTGSVQSALVAQNRATGAEVGRLPFAGPKWTLDGDLVAFDRREDIAVMNLVTAEIWTFPTVLGQIEDLAIHSETRRVAVSDENGIHIFDIDSGKLSLSIPIPEIIDLHWLTDERLVVGSRAGLWATLSLRADDLVVSATEALTRGFTQTECDTYRIDSCPTLVDIKARR